MITFIQILWYVFMARLYIKSQIIYVIMIIEGYSDGISLLAEGWRWNFTFKQFSEETDPSQFMSAEKQN